MAAGDRAAEQARIAGERVARLRRDLERAERNEQAWSVGAAGEAKVASKMDELAANGWQALHDVRWPGRPRANLDHVLIGPGGIIVIDAKNWSGNVQAGGGRLRQNGYRRDKEVLAASEQCAAVAALLEPQHRRHVQGWICLVAQPAIDEITGSAVRIVGLERLRPAVAGLPAVLDAAEVHSIHTCLEEQLAGSSSPRLLTTAQLATARPEIPEAPAAYLRQWQARHQTAPVTAPVAAPVAAPVPAPVAAPVTAPVAAPVTAPQAPMRRRPRGRRSKRPGRLLVLGQLIMLFVALSLMMNFAFGQRPTAPTTPGPAPSISQTLPAG